jgi:hypothetical protein
MSPLAGNEADAMGHWGVKSYEIDEASDALDSAFEKVHGAEYDELMDDRNPMTFDQIQKRLANTATLHAAVDALRAEFGDEATWDEIARLAYCGVIVRHAELGITIPEDAKKKAVSWLEHEEIDWQEATARGLRRAKEIALLTRK